MSLAILGLFKALSLFFPNTTRHFAPATARQSGLWNGNQPHWESVPPLTQRSAPSRRKPLKITRWVDQESGTQCAGRMVMSGRMDEVCAELDRLVAQESAREHTRPPC
jgi:hypothetical protein